MGRATEDLGVHRCTGSNFQGVWGAEQQVEGPVGPGSRWEGLLEFGGGCESRAWPSCGRPAGVLRLGPCPMWGLP